MRVLGIETSCDETGVAIYDSEQGLLADALYSQVAMHTEYGGVVPELASRDHVRKLLPLIREVLSTANLTLADLDAVAYTAGPGLIGALMVGASTGRALALGLGIPAIAVHHMEGHLLAPMLEERPPHFRLLRCWCPVGTPSWYGSMQLVSISCWASRWMMLPAKRLTRPLKCWGWSIPADH